MNHKGLFNRTGAFALLACFLSAGLASRAVAEEARIEVVLVAASDGGGGMDRSLRPFAGPLNRLFRFSEYRQVQKSTVRLSLPGRSQLRLQDGAQLKLESDGGSDGQLPVNLSWERDGRSLLRTGVRLRPGTPAALGGPAGRDGGVLLLIVRWVE